MPNILPETEVRGSLLVEYSEPKAKGISARKLQMIEITGSLSLILLWFFILYCMGGLRKWFCFWYCNFEF